LGVVSRTGGPHAPGAWVNSSRTATNTLPNVARTVAAAARAAFVSLSAPTLVVAAKEEEVVVVSVSVSVSASALPRRRCSATNEVKAATARCAHGAVTNWSPRRGSDSTCGKASEPHTHNATRK
jgi:hypothetical protein